MPMSVRTGEAMRQAATYRLAAVTQTIASCTHNDETLLLLGQRKRATEVLLAPAPSTDPSNLYEGVAMAGKMFD